MSARVLFRVHGQHAERIAQDCKNLIKGYLDLCDVKARVSVKPCDDFTCVKFVPYDLIIHTNDSELEKVARAAGWCYLEGIRTLEPVYNQARHTFHGNDKLAEALKDAEYHYESGLPSY